MKKILILGLIALSVSCTNSPKQSSSENADNFDWLLGKWERSNDSGDMATFETWEKKSASQYAGFGYTLVKTDTVWQENIQLLNKGDHWNFEVLGKDDAKPTIFTVTRIEKQGFVSENPEHDFPNQIIYHRNKNGLKATISGGEREVQFNFTKLSK